MAREHADQLLAQLEGTTKWPPPWECAWKDTRLWQALREADDNYLRRYVRWDTAENRQRQYIVDPMPSKISWTFAELVFGDDPTFTAGTTADQARLDEFVEENQMPSELQSAEDICSSEGEVWWRILVDPMQAPVPIVEWHSRLAVLPMFRGRHLLAAALVSTYRPPNARDQDKRLYRYFEIHADEVVYNVLFLGEKDKVGKRVALDDLQQTADLQDVWDHGLGMLCGRILNKRGRDPKRGVSDYAGVKDYLLALNETATIGQENARLTLKKRVVVPDSYLDVRGNFPAGADVLIAPTTDRDPDRPDQGLAQVEWSFDASAFIAYKEDLERTILGRVGLARQLVDAGNPTPDGRATGTALRLRLIPSMLETADKGRFWDDALPDIFTKAQMVDALPEERGGFAGQWSSPGQAPTIERSGSLPEDETEEATRHSTLVTAEIESRKTAIQELHPDWDETQVTAEIDQITTEAKSFLPSVMPPPPPGGDGSPLT